MEARKELPGEINGKNIGLNTSQPCLCVFVEKFPQLLIVYYAGAHPEEYVEFFFP